MKHIVYQTSGTCSQQIDLDIDDDGRVWNVQFLGGCNGNLQGIGRLVNGMKVEEIKERLGGIRCGYKNTSCPDQLARALEQAE
ncbi:MAG: TIGR03905 family TSCPD domain-containing protein [Prevotella sp.]|nr:TIGR03905 family TSCPD domain-containing protein [Prevotella sp.]